MNGRDIFSNADWHNFLGQCIKTEKKFEVIEQLTSLIEKYHAIDKQAWENIDERCLALAKILELCQNSELLSAIPVVLVHANSEPGTPLVPFLKKVTKTDSQDSLFLTHEFYFEEESRKGNLQYFINTLQKLARNKMKYLESLQKWHKKAVSNPGKTWWLTKDEFIAGLKKHNEKNNENRLKLFRGCYLEKIDPAHRDFEFDLELLLSQLKKDTISFSPNVAEILEMAVGSAKNPDEMGKEKLKEKHFIKKTREVISRLSLASPRNAKKKEANQQIIIKNNARKKNIVLVPHAQSKNITAINKAVHDWILADTQLPFFLWLENHPVLTNVRQQEHIATVSYRLKKQIQVYFKDQFVYFKAEKNNQEKLLNSMTVKKYMPKPGTRIGAIAFVWTRDGKFITHPHQAGKWHHSSLCQGHSVKSAGMWKVEEGKITYISNNSGHYKPGTLNFYLLILHLHQQQVLNETTDILDLNFPENKAMKLQSYLRWVENLPEVKIWIKENEKNIRETFSENFQNTPASATLPTTTTTTTTTTSMKLPRP